MAGCRNQNLDALRGVAILLVVGHHLNYLAIWTRVGWAGVDLFFVLSGFLISGLLFQEWQNSGSIDVRRFYIRRGFKIYPAFYALLIVTLVVSLIYPGISSYPVNLRSLLAEATFSQNYFQGIWGQTWSLAVEEHFYILLPIFLWLMYRGSRNRTDPFDKLPAVFMVFATLALVLRLINARTHPGESRYLFPSHLRFDALLIGVLLGYYRHFQPEKFKELARSRGALVIIVFMTLLLLLVPESSPVMYTLGFTLNVFGFGFLLVRTIDIPYKGRISQMILTPLAKTGYYSYSIYLWHGWVCRLVPHESLLAFLGCIAACIGLGVVTAKVIEYPALAIRDRFFPAPDPDRSSSEPVGMALTT